ncbi:major capsid protein [Aeromonas phage B614]|nr:major capsid protein [Aeromonas phage B614]UYD58264.1 major capsid protein [Aeromonas phage UP87]UYD58378.1 major capsid protein [Aeromonas phage avDM14-QBC]UYD58842.1 major capsid protein [Aeromonas phage avDM10-HWA]UYD59103.1 major capsid protein [Aeromonas phage avDM7-IJDJ]UYD59915.1 major capsid protein [Aeromonas phage avDM9-HANS]
MSLKNKEILNKWTPLLEGEGLPEIAGKNKQALVAQILEAQEKDATTDPVYRDDKLIEAFGQSLQEAEVAGDHGYDPTNIAAGQSSGAITNIGPAVIGMVRRAIPSLIAFDIAGVQPMTGPTGQVFALRSVYGKDPLAAGAKEAFHPMYAPDAWHSGLAAKGATTTSEGTPFAKLTAGQAIAEGDIVGHFFYESGTAFLQNTSGASLTIGTSETGEALDTLVNAEIAKGKLAEIAEGMATSIAELREGFNGSQNNPWNEMSFRIDKQTVEAKSRQLKAQYSIELAQDLRAVHGMDADSELNGILANEVMLEINREVIDWINYTAQPGKSGWTKTEGSAAGVFDFQDPIDVRGARWAGESYKALLIQIDKEANEIARQTGRGAGNFIIASRNVVSALALIDTNISPAAQGMASGLNADTTKGVFAGVLGGRYKVYIDQYARQDYFTMGYRGANNLDAGIYYCPYVALTPLRGADPKNFQPVMGFKTRYAIGVNPFAESRTQAPVSRISSGMPGVNSVGKNAYFRRVWVKGL